MWPSEARVECIRRLTLYPFRGDPEPSELTDQLVYDAIQQLQDEQKAQMQQLQDEQEAQEDAGVYQYLRKNRILGSAAESLSESENRSILGLSFRNAPDVPRRVDNLIRLYKYLNGENNEIETVAQSLTDDDITVIEGLSSTDSGVSKRINRLLDWYTSQFMK